MKNLFLTLLLVSGSNLLTAQTWQWAREEAAGPEGIGLCHDNAGNIFTTGYINSTGVIGSYTLAGTGNSAFVAKYDPDGNVLWATNCAGAFGRGVSCDATGNVFMTGYFTNTCVVGNQTFTASGSMDMLLVKYSSIGSLIWATQIGGAGSETANGISVDSQGDVIICGEMSASSFTVSSSVLTNTGGIKYVVVKYSSSGVPLWGLCGQANANSANSVTNDGNDDIYVTGSFIYALSIGSSTFVSAGSSDFFIAKFSSTGVPIWCNAGGGSGADVGYCVKVDPAGNIFASGAFNSTCAVGNSTFISNGSDDWFYAKYAPSGPLLATNNGGGTGSEMALSIEPYSGGVYVGGSLGLQGMQFGSSMLTPTSASDAMFFCQFDAAGNPLYGSALNGGGDDVMALTMYNGCNLYLSGDILTPTITLGTYTLMHISSEVLFVAKFNTGITSPTLNLNSSYTVCAGNSITLTASGASTYTWNGGPNTGSYVVSPLTTTNYIIAGTSTTGCSTKTIVTVVVDSMGISVLSATPFCTGNSATLTVNGASTYSWNTGATASTAVISPTVSTSYTVNGLTANGCTYSAVQTVTVKAVTPVVAAANHTQICKGNSVTLTATGATSYTWSTGSHASTMVLAPASTTVLTLSGTDNVTQCTTSSTVQVTVNSCLSLDGIQAFALDIFPNPNSGSFKLRVTGKISRMVLQSVSGEILYETEIPADSAVTVQHLIPGIYFVVVFTDEGYIARKIIVE